MGPLGVGVGGRESVPLSGVRAASGALGRLRRGSAVQSFISKGIRRQGIGRAT